MVVIKSSLAYLLVAAFSAFLVTSCGSGGGSSSTGSAVSGNVMKSSSGAVTARTALSSAIEDTADTVPFEGAVVQLIDSDGTIVAETTTDADGYFIFEDVDPDDYTVVVFDPDTDEEVANVSITVIEGDDATVDGTVTGDGTTWDVEFTADEDVSLDNPTQQAKVTALAEDSDLSESEIIAMRESGMGWGKIANDLGIHPSVLGAGSGKDSDDDDTDEDDETFDTDDDDSNGKGNDKDKGNNGNGNGNSGNNGNGNGNDDSDDD